VGKFGSYIQYNTIPCEMQGFLKKDRRIGLHPKGQFLPTDRKEYGLSFQRSVPSPERGSRPAEVNIVRFPNKDRAV
jgi:hypothetical protein